LLDGVHIDATLALVKRHPINHLDVTLAKTIQEVVDILSGHDVHVVALVLGVHPFKKLILLKLYGVDNAAVGYEDKLIFLFVELLELGDH
jgi:hypothetical protein